MLKMFEKYLSNGVIKVHIWEIKVFANLAVPMCPWSEAEKWQIRALTKFWIEIHHLKGIFLSFQKIIKILTLDQLYWSYGCWKMFNYTSTPSVQSIYFSCHNLNFVDPKSKVLWFSESLEKYLSNCVIKVHIWEIKEFANLTVPWIIAHGPRPKNDKLGPLWNFGLKYIIWKVFS